MLPARYKLIRLNCESHGKSAETPACEEIELNVELEAEDGSRKERSSKMLAYTRIMSDPDQYSSLIAEAVRKIMRG